MLVTVKELRKIAQTGSYPWIDSFINGKSDSESINLINRDDYIATKLWSLEDIKKTLIEKGYEGTEEQVSSVANTGYLKDLEDCTDGDWNIIYDAIQEAVRTNADLFKQTNIMHSKNS